MGVLYFHYTAWKNLTAKHVEALLNRTESAFGVTGDKVVTSSSDVTVMVIMTVVMTQVTASFALCCTEEKNK
jgi:hypothetical protein